MDDPASLSLDGEQSGRAKSTDSAHSADSAQLRQSTRRQKFGRVISTDKQQAKAKGSLAKALSRTSDDPAALLSRDSDGTAAPDDDDDDLMLAVCDADELRDLAFAFTACDIDNSNSLEVDELHAMLVVQCNSITGEQVDHLMRAGKAHYEKWYAEAASDVDHKEVVHRMMKVAGLNIGNQTKHGTARTFAELKFEEKKKPMGTAQLLDSTVGLAAAVIDQTVDSTVNKAAAAIDQTAAAISVKPDIRFQSSLVDDEESAVPQLPPQFPSTGNSLEGLTLLESQDDGEHELSLSFPEYVFTMQCKELGKLMDFDAHILAAQMRAFRNAFDAVDVDGNNMLEYDDLEIVTLTLNPRLLLSEEDLLGLWQVVTKDAIVRHAESVRRDAADELRKQRKKEVKAIDQKLTALDDEQVQLEKRLKLRFAQEITPKEETWLRKEVARVCMQRDALRPGRQALIDALLKPELELEPEPAPEAGPGPGPILDLESDSGVVQVVQIEGLIKCQYARKGDYETVWLSVSNDGTILFRDITGIPPGFQGTWQGTVVRTANVVQSSVRDQKRRRGRSKTQRQAVRIDLLVEDSCGDKKYAMRSVPKKKRSESSSPLAL